jgi:hypothetical protein
MVEYDMLQVCALTSSHVWYVAFHSGPNPASPAVRQICMKDLDVLWAVSE